MLHSTFPTTDDHVADLTVMSVSHLTNAGDGVFEARLHCMDPTGQISHLTVRYYWFFGMPEIDLEQVLIDGDAKHGSAFAARYTKRLRPVLIAANQQISPTT